MARPHAGPSPRDRRGFSLLSHLLLLVAAVAVPLLVLGTAMLWDQFHTQRARAEALLVDQARVVAQLVDDKFRRIEQGARILAAAPAMAGGDIDAIKAELDGAAAAWLHDLQPGGGPVEIVFTDGHGAMVLDTAAPETRRYRALPAMQAAVESGVSGVTNLISGPGDRDPFVAVVVPLYQGSAAGGPHPSAAIVVVPTTARLVQLISGPDLPGQSFGSIQDRHGVTVARSFRHAETVGKLPVPVVLKAIIGAASGLAPRGTPTLEGVPSIIAFAHAPRSGFIVKLDVAEAVFLAPLLEAVFQGGLIAAAVLAVCIGLALVLVRRIVHAFRQVLADEDSLEDAAPPLTTGVREADTLAAVCRAMTRQRDKVVTALRQSEATARILFQNSPVGVVVSGVGGRVESVNDAFLAIIGRARPELERDALDWGAMTPREWHQLDAAAVQAAIETGHCTPYEKEYLRPDGSRVPVLVSFGLIDRTAGTAATFATDLTDRKAAAAALRDSEQRFRTLIDAMPLLVWSGTPDGNRDYCNVRCYEFSGLPPGALNGIGWQALGHPDERSGLRANWRHCLQTGDIFEAVCRLRRHDGVYRWMLARAVPMLDPNGSGRIIRWFGSATDITEMAAARDVLARSRADLESLIEARTRELQDAQRRLAHSERMEALGQLAGGIAHDFNNVLQTVQAGSSMIRRRADTPNEVRRLSRMISEAAERGSAITHRLLGFSRRGDLLAEPVDAAELLSAMREILCHTLGTGIEVRVSAPDGLPPLLADKGQLETVLVNLATNARDAMAGQGILTLAAAGFVAQSDELVRRHLRFPPGRYVCLTVADTGCGMDAVMLERVTEPFFTTKPQGQGTGLGLAMARGFAEQSGGGLEIVSAPGRGTMVNLWFPVAAGRVIVADTGMEAHPRFRDKDARIMLVDDDALVRETVADQLTSSGLIVSTFASGAEALARLDTATPPDLLIADLSMPVMDGVTLIREARRRRPGLPAIMLTGFATNAADFNRDEAFLLLRKPIDGRTLVDHIAALLETAAAAHVSAGGD